MYTLEAETVLMISVRKDTGEDLLPDEAKDRAHPLVEQCSNGSNTGWEYEGCERDAYNSVTLIYRGFVSGLVHVA